MGENSSEALFKICQLFTGRSWAHLTKLEQETVKIIRRELGVLKVVKGVVKFEH